MSYIKKLSRILSVSVLLLLAIHGCTPEMDTEKAAKEEWVQLFNGIDMKGWTPKFSGYVLGENFNDTFVVKDSMLSVRYTKYDSFADQFGHLFYKDKFSHYKLKAKYRFVGEQVKNGPGWAKRNNGLMLHAQSPESMDTIQNFPICMELQLLGGFGAEERPTGNLCTPGSHVHINGELSEIHCMKSSSKTYFDEQWVTVEAVVLGDSLIHHIIESDTVMTYTKPVIGGSLQGSGPDVPGQGNPMTEGYITIQAETAPTDFKSIELLNLCGCMDPEAKNYKSYFVKDDKGSCEY